MATVRMDFLPTSFPDTNHVHRKTVGCRRLLVVESRTLQKPSHQSSLQLPKSLSNLLHLHPHLTSTKASRNLDIRQINSGDRKTPTESPKEQIAGKWQEIHGSDDWTGLLDPLHPWLRREIVKYGEFAQATYDAFDFDNHSKYCGSCRYNCQRLFDQLGLTKNGYDVTKYIYAMSHVDLPRWIERSLLSDTWSRDSNWMGYVAVSGDNESIRIGRRDIVVAWRGTVAPTEWLEDLQGKLESIGDGDVRVEQGFLSIYKSKSEFTRYNKHSASEQVMKEITRLVSYYRLKGEEVSLTITGHSLGGALALLNANEAAASLPEIPISVFNFGAPRVGNAAFRDRLHQMKVKTLRVVIKQDWVPHMPGVLLNESLERFKAIIGAIAWAYKHVGVELKLDVSVSPYLSQRLDLAGFHSLETYLHLVDGFLSGTSSFRMEARRDVALVNKACGMLLEELGVPKCWYQLGNKGLVCNSHGRWVQPSRDLEDIPLSPWDVSNPCLG